MPDQVPVPEVGAAPRTAPAVWICFRCVVQCVDCCTQIEAEIVNPTPDDPESLHEAVVRCPVCSKSTGGEVGIPVLLLVGDRVAELTAEEGEEEGEEGADPGDQA